MNKRDAVSVLSGFTFVVLGAVLIGTLLDYFDSASVYGYVLPTLLIVGGIQMLRDTPQKNLTNTGILLILVGIVALLVRFSVISGDTVNAIIGIFLITIGSIILARQYGTRGKKELSETKE